MKRLLVVVVLLVGLLSVGLVNAQDAVAFGDVIEAEMTASDYEFEYTFEGAAGDVVIFDLQPVDPFGDLDEPVLVLTNEDGVVASTVDAFNYGEATLVAQLPADGEYTLLATRDGGVAGDSVGEFTLEFVLAEVLETGAVVEGTATSDVRPNYYVVTAASDWAISYVKQGGVLPAQVAVNVIDEDAGSLEPVATLFGPELTDGLFGVFPAEELYIVTVSEPDFYFAFDEETADYELEVVLID